MMKQLSQFCPGRWKTCVSGVALGVALLAVGCESSGGAEGSVAADEGSLVGDSLSGDLAAGTVLQTTASVNLRSEPEIADNIETVLPKGTQVIAVGGGPTNGFYAVSSGDQQGFISAKYLVRVATSNPSPPSGGSFRVVYIGDSHSDYAGNTRGWFGFLGQHVGENLENLGISLALYAASGSTPDWWLDGTPVKAASYGYTQTSASPPIHKTCAAKGQNWACVPKLGAILDSRPDLFVIEQGTNMLENGTNSSQRALVQKMVDVAVAHSDRCLWVAAPSSTAHPVASQDQLFKNINDVASPSCFVYDSRYLPRVDSNGDLELDGKGQPIIDVPLPYSPDAHNHDGEHFGMTGAGKWADGVSRIINFLRTTPPR